MFPAMMNTSKGLKIIHINIRSLYPKIDLLRAWLSYNDPSIITLSETWLHSAISDNAIALDDYTLFRSDRGSRAGGVATYVKSNLTAELLRPRVNPINLVSFHQNFIASKQTANYR